MHFISPPYLKKGDTIALVSPARKIQREDIEFSVSLFQDWGLKVIYGKNTFGGFHQFSGTDEERREDLQQMLDDMQVKAIISTRGGYGTLRIIDQLDFSFFRKSPKWIAGFSDMTVLHSHLHVLKIQSIHAGMAATIRKNDESAETLRKALFGEPARYEVPPHPLNRRGEAAGYLTGGNLSLLYALQGSLSDIDMQGRILFLEDVDEYLYHIDRMMISLKRSGKLSRLAGLLVGGLSGMKDNEIPFGKSAGEIIRDAVEEFEYPVCFDFPAGHIQKNLALKLGTIVKFNVRENYASLEIPA